MNMKEPRIGLTVRYNLTNESFFLAKHYSQAVYACGGIPILLSLIPKKEYINSALDNVDGVLLPGGSDINPLRFGSDPHPRIGTVIDLRDETDLLVIEEAEQRNLPILGICYGMQIINVYRGGTIIQDIESEIPAAVQHESGEPRERLSHRLLIEKDTLLGKISNSETASVNSHHHQAVGKTGANLIVSARSSDKVIEAIEDPRPEKFVVGVQWHPELCFEWDGFSRNLFDAFLSRTKKR
jgi:putative glutamine amidotransferase